MGIVKIKDKTFKTSIPEAEILEKVKVVADRINKDFEGKTPVFLAVLNGSFIFAADLMRMITIPSEISFVKYASYEGTSSTGSMKTLMGINQELEGRHVVIVEDIVDSGFTMSHMIEDLKKKNPASIEICSLLVKPGNLKVDLDIKYAVMEIPTTSSSAMVSTTTRKAATSATSTLWWNRKGHKRCGRNLEIIVLMFLNILLQQCL